MQISLFLWCLTYIKKIWIVSKNKSDQNYSFLTICWEKKKTTQTCSEWLVKCYFVKRTSQHQSSYHTAESEAEMWHLNTRRQQLRYKLYTRLVTNSSADMKQKNTQYIEAGHNLLTLWISPVCCVNPAILHFKLWCISYYGVWIHSPVGSSYV